MTSIPRQPPPARRPRVAGIRRPSPSPRPKPADQPVADEPAAKTEAAPAAGEGKPRPRPEPTGAKTEPAPATDARKPRPRPKSRDAGVAKPVDYRAAEEAVAAPADEPRRVRTRPRNKAVIAGVLLATAIVFAGLAVWFKIEDNKLSAETANTALLDVARTAQVNQAATSAVETLFSYDYNNIAKTQNAAKDLLLNDDVRNKYNSLMGEVERLAPQQKMVVTVKVTRSAVIKLEGDQARVIVFVDQTATRTDQNQTSSGSSQLWVNMQYSGGKWKVLGLDTYKPVQPTPPPGK